MRDVKNSNGVPLYFQIKQSIQDKILEGEYKYNEKIPPEAELCREYEVSRITVRKAIDTLVQEKFLYTKQGVGTFVGYNKLLRELSRIYSFSEDMKNLGLTPSSEVLRAEIIPAPIESRETLSLPMTDLDVYRFFRIRKADDEPILLEDTRISHYICEDLLSYNFESDSLYRVLCEEYGLYPFEADETYEAALMSPEEARLLGCDPSQPHPVFHLTRIGYLSDGRVFEHTRAVVRGDHIRFKLHLGENKAAFKKDFGPRG